MTVHGGFDTGPLEHIELIRKTLLGGKLDVFFVVKELFQNADDEGARRISLGWSPGLPAAQHPLLRGPALFAVNDGKFRTEDAQAIRRIALGSKSGEAQKIGKFGMGLKSVFYLGEAFFYLVPSEESGSNLLNPWSSRDPEEMKQKGWARDWDYLGFGTADQSTMRTHLMSDEFVAGGVGPGFTVWVPLRLRAQVVRGSKEAPIHAEYFGEDGDRFPEQELGAELLGNIGELMPLLQNISLAEIVRPGSRATAKLVEGGRRGNRAFSGTHALAGVVEFSELEPLRFAGYESTLAGPGRLQALKNEDTWPITFESSLEALSQEPEKALPHGAVVFSRRRTEPGRGRLRIFWSVFLPVAEGQQELEYGGDDDIGLNLHGYFFLSLDRRRILDGPYKDADGNDRVRLEWNSLIAGDVTLPWVLPALRDFVAGSGVPDSQVKLLTEGLNRAFSSLQVFGRQRSAIYSSGTWLYRLRPSGGAEWCLEPAGSHVLDVPEPPTSELPETVLPGLSNEFGHRCVTYQGWPRLAKEGHARAAWSEHDVVSLLRQVNVERVFGSAERAKYLEYLKAFLAMDLVPKGELVIAAISKLLGRAFASDKVQRAPLQRSEAFNWLLDLVPPLQRLRLPTRETLNANTGGDVERNLIGLDLDCLLVPFDLAAADRHSAAVKNAARLSHGDARAILHCLAAGGQPPEAFVLGVINACRDDDRASLKATIRTLKLFGTNTPDGGETFKALEELDELRSAGQLFSRAGKELTGQLQGAIYTTIHTTNAEVGSLLRQGSSLPECDQAACLALLGRKVRLKGAGERRSLLRTLSGQAGKAEGRAALRYLLHARPDEFEDQALLFVKNDEHGSKGVWSKLLEDLMGPDEAWRFVPASLAEAVLDEQSQLGLEYVGKAAAVGRLTLNPTAFDASKYSDAERRDIVLGVEDLELLGRLRIHEPIGNSPVFIAVDDTTYQEGGFAVPSELAIEAGLVFLKRGTTPEVAKKQALVAPPLHAGIAACYALESSRPDRYWELILTALAQDSEGVCEHVGSLIHTVAWLPRSGKDPCRPEDVIHLPALADEVTRLVAECPDTFVDAASLEPGVLHHRGFARLNELEIIPGRPKSIEMLGQTMIGDERFSVGSAEIILTMDSAHQRTFGTTTLSDWFLALEGAPAKIMPALPVLRSLGDEAAILWSELSRPLNSERMIELLEYLATAAEDPGDHGAALAVHGAYLKRAADYEDWPDLLGRIRLRNRLGKWKPTSQLCYGAAGIDAADVLEEAQAKPIRLDANQGITIPDLRGEEPPQLNETLIAASAATLKRYFSQWEGGVEPEAVGFFLGLLGGDLDIKKLAERYLPRLDYFRAQLDEFTPPTVSHWFPGVYGSSFFGDLDSMREKLRFQVTVVEGDTCRVASVAGRSFEAQLETSPREIIAGSLAYLGELPDKLRCVQLNLRRLDPRTFQGKLERILLESVRNLLRNGYRQMTLNLDEVWHELDKAEQLGVDVAQSRLLHALPFYLQQLGGFPQDSEISHALRDLNRVDQDLHIQRSLKTKGKVGEESVQLAEVEVGKQQRRLEALVTKNQEAQRLILEAVRTRVGHHNYAPRSIPFELFQNADDAYVQLEEMGGIPETSKPRFVATADGASVAFMHWGRRINQEQSGGRFDGRARGFDLDLEKMLVLNAGKGEATEDSNDDFRITGKYGLGFKSVFLISSQPKVISGRLGFTVLAGVYPESLVGDSFMAVNRRLEDEGDARRGTLIELPVSDQSAESVLAEFEYLAAPLLAFAQRIKNCTVRDQSGERRFGWSEEALAPGVFLGEALPGPDWLHRALTLRAHEATLLLPLGPRGVSPAPDDVPTLWITAPTVERAGLGFAVNATFEVNTGRTQLVPGSVENARLAALAGAEFGQVLEHLHSLSLDWASFKKRLNLARDATPYEFWDSVWDLLITPFAEVSSTNLVSLLGLMLLPAGRGMGRLVEQQDVMPSKLTGDYMTLTRPDQVQAALVGVLDKDPDVFATVASWPSFRDSFPPQAVISAKMLSSLCAMNLSEPTLLGLADVLGAALPSGGPVQPDAASRIGEVVHDAFLSRLDESERLRVRDSLVKATFRGLDGNPHQPSELLLTGTGSEEAALAAFAPDDHLLAPDYVGAALRFFLACRGDPNFGSLTLAGWAVGADTPDRKRSVLRYILNGQAGNQLVGCLFELRSKGWLGVRAQVETAWAGGHFTEEDQARLLSVLGLVDAKHVLGQSATKKPAVTYPPTSLNRIYGWWIENRTRLVQEYDSDVYPDPIASSKLTAGDHDLKHPKTRERWLVTLLLGAFHTMGRQTPGQHKGFLKLCREWGWFDVLGHPKPPPAKWTSLVHNYFENSNDELLYMLWMGQYPAIYELSTWLDDYALAFQDIDKLKRDFSLRNYLRPRSNPDYSGTGVIAPAITRTLGIGACFVVRELLRAGILQNERANRYAYVPTLKVRDLLTSLGCPGLTEGGGVDNSKIIHTFLTEKLGEQKAVFLGDFDLPFQMLTSGHEQMLEQLVT